MKEKCVRIDLSSTNLNCSKVIMSNKSISISKNYKKGASCMENKDFLNLSPNDFEIYVGNLLEEQGFEIKHFNPGDDIGIDLIATNKDESIAIQVKKYVKRKVNLAMVYHTYGASAYYNCTRRAIVTLNVLTPNAIEAAKKLNVEIWDKDYLLTIVASDCSPKMDIIYKNSFSEDWFLDVWNTHIKELQGKEVKHLSRTSHITIVVVDEDGLSIINSNGRYRNFSIDIFIQILTKLKNEGKITREEINDEYQRRGSSAISAIIATIPGVYKDTNAKKTTLVWVCKLD